MELPELLQEFNKKKAEVTQSRDELNRINSVKENFYKEKREVSKKIFEDITRIKDLRKERDTLTAEVRELKGERQKHSAKVKEKISEVQEVNKQRKEVQDKYHISGDPTELQRQMDHLETKIETEPMSFDKEQKIMKLIKQLKKKLGEATKISNVWTKSHEVRKEIDEEKKMSDDLHKKVQKQAEESQKRHEELITLSNEVKELKKKEEETLKGYIKEKTTYDEIKKKLEEELKALNELSRQIDEMKGVKTKEKKARKDEEVNKIVMSVEEKIKKKQKLTTEDLLAFQAKEE